MQFVFVALTKKLINFDSWLIAETSTRLLTVIGLFRPTDQIVIV